MNTYLENSSIITHLIYQENQTEKKPPLRLRCYCTALTARSWKLHHGNAECDGTICAPFREEAEKRQHE